MKLSVIVPVYNAEKYLRQCVDSLVNQTFSNMEIILVNDGSNDGSGVICEEYCKKYNNVKYIDKRNEGVMAAWIDGAKISEGEYIGFVDADDYCETDRFEQFINSAEKTQADIVIAGHMTIDLNGNISNAARRGSISPGVYEGEDLEYIKNTYFKESYFSALRWEKITKNELIRRNISSFNTEIALGDDIVFTLATLLDAKKLSVIENNGYYYRYNGNSITHSFSEKRIDELCYLCENINHICKSKGYDAYKDLEFKRQLSVTTTMLISSNKRFFERRKLLKKLRRTDTVKNIFADNKYPIMSMAEKMKLYLLKHKCYTMLIILAQLKKQINESARK